MLKLSKSIIFAIVSLIQVNAQSISGYITDTDLFPLQGATIVVDEQAKGTATNEEGYFLLENLLEGEYTISVSHVGYKSQKQIVIIRSNQEDIDYFNLQLKLESQYLDELIISSLRVQKSEPFSYTNLSKPEIDERNLGQDIPYLFNQTPSTVVTSDAGTGIGYTGIRIRGSDPTRINVTINGIPYNDPESQGVFWVNLPDFASSIDDVQIQRGVGSSTNGSGAFGASINIGTLSNQQDAYGRLSNTIGSFNTRKHSLSFGTGLLNSGFTLDGRLSTIKSDGYIDRASADLKSYYLSGAYYKGSSTIKAIIFSGKERTYQSWYGTPQSRLENDVEAMKTHAVNNGYSIAQTENLLSAGRTYNNYLYENEVDNYNQDHYQLHFSHEATSGISLSTAIHYTKGAGYFEQFREEDDFADYGLSAQSVGEQEIDKSDLIRRRWLDNDYYGIVFNVGFSNPKYTLDVGGAINKYVGDHFGEIIWARVASDFELNHRYYDNTGEKSEANLYSKLSYAFTPSFNFYGDLQLRRVTYQVEGLDNDQRSLSVKNDLKFFNPKIGVNLNLDEQSQFYFSYARGSKEPDRNDYVDASPGVTPLAEKLNDFEMGLKRQGKLNFFGNLYFMHYKDQLVLTGALNDVGSSIRTNVPDSYRLGLELSADYKLNNSFGWGGNLTLSRNKIKSFTETLYDYTNGFDVLENEFEDTDISFSPNLIASNTLTYKFNPKFKVSLLSKYVGKQYLDNTSNDDKVINGFFSNDLLANVEIPTKTFKLINVKLQVNNLFNTFYSSNGYTYSYIFGDTITENFYYPQAGINFLVGLTLDF